MAGHVEIHAFKSSLLEANPLGDDPIRQVPVYVPGHEHPKGWPVLYALAGFTGTGLSMLNYDWYQENLPRRLDRLIGTGAMEPAVVVMVDGMTAIGGNQYIDSGAVGPWARHITEELVPWAEGRFPIRPGRAHRGVFGKSSGGYGSLMMAIEHADVFHAAASHSGDCYFEYCYRNDFPAAIDGLRAAGGLAAFLRDLRTHDKFPGHLFPALNIVAMSHFYSPTPGEGVGFELPFDPDTGELRDEVFARWLRRDPVRLVADHRESLGQLGLLYIECGSRDEYHLHHGARILSARLRDEGIPHEHVEFPDTHRSLNYRYDASLPRLVAALQG